MIAASQRMIDVQSQVGGEAGEEGWRINPVMKKHLELEIKTLLARMQKEARYNGDDEFKEVETL